MPMRKLSRGGSGAKQAQGSEGGWQVPDPSAGEQQQPADKSGGKADSGQSASGQSASGQSASGQSASGQSASGESAAGVIASLHQAKQELAQEMEANLKQLKAVLKETQRIAKDMEAVLEESKSAWSGQPAGGKSGQSQATDKCEGGLPCQSGGEQDEWQPPVKAQSQSKSQPQPQWESKSQAQSKSQSKPQWQPPGTNDSDSADSAGDSDSQAPPPWNPPAMATDASQSDAN
ncbi:MAG TPA: hypothetical protein VGK74_14375 [Symbiobacteriaceae bacterium]